MPHAPGATQRGRSLRGILRDPRGQGLVEYGLILAGVAIVAVVTLVFFGDQVAGILDVIGNAIDRATGT